MQTKVFEFVKKVAEDKGLLSSKVLDVGARDINGTLRPIFDTYTGYDLISDSNVDVVGDAHDMPFADGSFDCVTCVEMLEHDDDPFATLSEIYRVLRKGGVVILAASGISFPYHEYPCDYFRYTPDGLGVLLRKFNGVAVSGDENEVYGYGVK